jgi:hypothetical protein
MRAGARQRRSQTSKARRCWKECRFRTFRAHRRCSGCRYKRKMLVRTTRRRHRSRAGCGRQKRKKKKGGRERKKRSVERSLPPHDQLYVLRSPTLSPSILRKARTARLTAIAAQKSSKHRCKPPESRRALLHHLPRTVTVQRRVSRELDQEKGVSDSHQWANEAR